MLQTHDKDTNSETSIRKWYFSAMRMNNLTFRNIMLQIHDKDTTSETNIRKWYFSAMRMNNLMFRNIMLQTHDKDTTKQASKTSFRRWYFRQWRWTIWCSEISWKSNNSVVQRWIFDKYLSTHTSTIFVTSRQKNIHHGQQKKYLSESYAVDAVGSTSSKLEIFCLALLFHKKVMVDIWLFDEKSIGSYNTKKYLMKWFLFF